LQNWRLPPQIQPGIALTGTAIDCDAGRPSTGHSGGSNVAMADGSVRTVAGNVRHPGHQPRLVLFV
jgi:prepilin-type processing-associated H-X9-DG protein